MLKFLLQKFVFLSIFLSFSFSVPSLLKRVTKGFKPGKIFFQHSCVDEGFFQKKPSHEIEKILSGKFVFLDKGAQCYVFESLDRNYVVKIFRHNNKVFRKKSVKIPLQTFTESSCIAQEHLFQETALLYVHLQKTCDLFGEITLTNPLGESFVLSLDDCIFALQRKAKVFSHAILEDVLANNQLGLQRKMASFFHLITARLEKNIENIDPDLSTNFGFIGDDAVEIDIGNFQFRKQDPFSAQKKYQNLWVNWIEQQNLEIQAVLKNVQMGFDENF